MAIRTYPEKPTPCSATTIMAHPLPTPTSMEGRWTDLSRTPCTSIHSRICQITGVTPNNSAWVTISFHPIPPVVHPTISQWLQHKPVASTKPLPKQDADHLKMILF